MPPARWLGRRPRGEAASEFFRPFEGPFWPKRPLRHSHGFEALSPPPLLILQETLVQRSASPEITYTRELKLPFSGAPFFSFSPLVPQATVRRPWWRRLFCDVACVWLHNEDGGGLASQQR